ncbi:hypothetical protein FJZ17_00895 [Candidatus Pacearchaeota archaeon]|nr:hypothetical protein [Candidatus Pacearchaeota archaeon]
MRYEKRQERVQEQVEDLIDELAGEFDLPVPFYPNVRLITVHTDFNELGIPQRYYLPLVAVLNHGTSTYLKSQKTLVTAKPSRQAISEEATHFLHLVNSRIRLAGKNSSDLNAVNIIIEALGFLGSKTLEPSRENIFQGTLDILPMSLEEEQDYLTRLATANKWAARTLKGFAFHQQGYGLGERMFYDWIQRGTTTREIRNLFLASFGNPGDATRAFRDLRERYWPIPGGSDLVFGAN